MRGSSGQSSEERRLGRPLHALAAVTALLAFLAFSSSAMASSAPVIESESATNITSTSATLGAVIDPNGLETGYEFQIDTIGSYNYTQPVCPQLLPAEITCDSIIDGPEPPVREPQPQQIAAGLGGQAVSLDLASIGTTLQPGTTYHYRVIAANAGSPTVQGPDQTFTTPPGGTAGAAPSINGVSVSGVTEDGATLEAQINPGGLATTYEFWVEYGCGIGNHDSCLWLASKSVGHGQIAAGDEAQAVSADAALEPGHAYDYWVVATNSDGETRLDGGIFTTPPASSGAPKIDSESVSKVTEHDATLEAQINTEGLETSYQFRLSSICGGKGVCLVVINYPLPSGNLDGSFVDQSVSLDLDTAGVTLQPGGTYTYSVSATNASGTTESPPHSFTTPEDAVQPLSVSTTTSPPSGGGQSGTSSTPATSGGPSSTPSLTPLVSPLQNTAEPEALTKVQKLSKALKQCKKEPKRKRAACEKQAHQKYASVAKKSKKG